MTIFDREALEQSPLADLHAIASELGLDGYRRLRKAALIDAVIERQGGEAASSDTDATTAAAPDVEAAAEEDEETSGTRRRRGRRGGRRSREEATAEEEHAARRRRGEPEQEEERATRRQRGEPEREEERPTRRRRGESEREEEDRPALRPRSEPESEQEPPARRRRGRTAEEEREPEAPAEPVAEGVVEVLSNGSAFLRVNPPDPSDEDIYVSAAQVKRCELVTGDRIAGPRRAPRRSERFASLVRVDTINGRPASEVADAARFDDLQAAFATERFRLGSDDPTLKAIESLTPFGRGSRVVISGPAQAGKSEALRRIAGALAGEDDVQLLLVLAGVRPEEVADWSNGLPGPAATVTLAGSADAQAQAVERVIDQGRRLVARGNHVVVAIDTLAGLTPSQARRALASARRIVDGGSLTVIATAAEALGAETTVICLDPALTTARRFPALDLTASWTMRAELLVDEKGVEEILRTRTAAFGL